MPIFCWTALASNLLIIAAFPILTATFAMLLLDRYLGFHFFTNELGGNAMMYVNLIWAWGHPEVYILILPAFGVFSEVIATFSGKPLFGYRSMVIATMAICVLSFMVWLHHFFTMGAGADVNGFFGVMTMIIAVPTGVKVFNWLFTMYGGTVRFSVPMLWALGFMVTFVIGGMTGVLLAIPPVDFVLHNSLFLVAHFHNVIIGGVLFGAFAGYTYWFPKAFGFTLHEGWGKAAFWCWLVGFYLAFMPLYVLGLMGATRRMQHYADTGWQPLMLVALAGAVVILAGIALHRRAAGRQHPHARPARDTTGDPWNGRTLEWSIASPPPAWNFATPAAGAGTRCVLGHQARRKPEARTPSSRRRRPRRRHRSLSTCAIDVPTPSALGFVIAFFAVVFGFGMVWHICWLARGRRGRASSAAVLWHSWRTDASEVAIAHRRAARAAGSQSSLTARRDSQHRWRDDARGDAVPRSERGPAPTRVVVTYGFWLFLLSDIVMFAAFFAAYAVLHGHTAGGPVGRELFDRDTVLIETGCLLLSSFTCGADVARRRPAAQAGELRSGPASRLLLGAAFLALEAVRIRIACWRDGAGPTRSAFLSAFFALVGLHGLHVSVGLLLAGRRCWRRSRPSASRRAWCGRCSASACSGMRSTSSGSASSRSSTWERSHESTRTDEPAPKADDEAPGDSRRPAHQPLEIRRPASACRSC